MEPRPEPLLREPSPRWDDLARAAGSDPREPVVLALSGGADSVLLLHLIAEADPRPAALAVHVDHGLRGEESRADAAFCRALCKSLGIAFELRRASLDPTGSGLEQRARRERYRILRDAAESFGARTVVAGHHADDALETLLLRWFRGTSLPGLAGLRPRAPLPSPPTESSVREPGGDVMLVRPLMRLGREEVRALLRARRGTWREDSSNTDPRFARNRVRHEILPALERAGGAEALENLRAFYRAVEGLECELGSATDHLRWTPHRFTRATRGFDETHLGGTIPRVGLASLPAPLRRRALWRLLTEGTGRSPRAERIARIAAEIAGGRCTRFSLPGGWSLVLRAAEVLLLPPSRNQAPAEPLELPLPGSVRLPDGRSLEAVFVERTGETDESRPVPRAGTSTLLLDPRTLPARLLVRWARPGDRFRAAGAPGSRPLRRFLADAGVPREERGRVPIVCAGDRILWVAGLRAAEGTAPAADAPLPLIRLTLSTRRQSD